MLSFGKFTQITLEIKVYKAISNNIFIIFNTYKVHF